MSITNKINNKITRRFFGKGVAAATAALPLASLPPTPVPVPLDPGPLYYIDPPDPPRDALIEAEREFLERQKGVFHRIRKRAWDLAPDAPPLSLNEQLALRYESRLLGCKPYSNTHRFFSPDAHPVTNARNHFLRVFTFPGYRRGGAISMFRKYPGRNPVEAWIRNNRSISATLTGIANDINQILGGAKSVALSSGGHGK